jgi:hypothetical protein
MDAQRYDVCLGVSSPKLIDFQLSLLFGTKVALSEVIFIPADRYKPKCYKLAVQTKKNIKFPKETAYHALR